MYDRAPTRYNEITGPIPTRPLLVLHLIAHTRSHRRRTNAIVVVLALSSPNRPQQGMLHLFMPDTTHGAHWHVKTRGGQAIEPSCTTEAKTKTRPHTWPNNPSRQTNAHQATHPCQYTCVSDIVAPCCRCVAVVLAPCPIATALPPVGFTHD